jgi:hypothetical protein
LSDCLAVGTLAMPATIISPSSAAPLRLPTRSPTMPPETPANATVIGRRSSTSVASSGRQW